VNKAQSRIGWSKENAQRDLRITLSVVSFYMINKEDIEKAEEISKNEYVFIQTVYGYSYLFEEIYTWDLLTVSDDDGELLNVPVKDIEKFIWWNDEVPAA